MIDRILKMTRGRPCSCPSGKICTACKKKKVVPPQVYVEEPRRLPAPVTISYYRPNEKTYKQTPTVQYVEKPSRWRLRKQDKYEPEPKQSPICKWYRRKRALNQLIAEHKKEQEQLKREKRQRYEQERMRELMEWEANRQKYRSQSINEGYKWIKTRSKSLPPSKKSKMIIKERSASAKPRAKSKYVASKKFSTKESISRRFVNYCYRLCCQFYCYLTCILLVVFTVVCVF